jgi:hypothetical protein
VERHRGVLPLTQQIHELEIDKLDAILLCELKDLGWGHGAVSLLREARDVPATSAFC